MSFTVRAKCSKCVHKNGDFTIHSWIPIGDTKELRLSRYLTFSTKGENAYLSIEREYDLELEEVSYDPKFGGTYKIISCPNLEEIDIDNLTFEESMEILLECTSSPTIAKNILSAYPNYISLVLKEGKDVINTKLIKGVGEVYNSAYVRDLNAKFKYYKCLSEYKCYKLDVSDCKALYEVYNDYEKIVKAMDENPYTCLCNVMKKSFDYADKLILQERPELKLSDQRCEFAILDVLLRNEMDKSTRINGNTVYTILRDEYNVSELLPLVRPVCEKSNLIYYNEELKYLSVMDTYMAESFISNFIKERINNSSVLNIDWKKYSTPNGLQMTDKQVGSLELFCKYNFSLLVGYSGCVDADTEFFDGTKWKKISEYEDGDSVLQYNLDGSSNLVNPNAYVKLPSESLWHFETKYGVSQTLSDEHRIIYTTPKGIRKECTMEEMKDIQELRNGNKSGFTGKFPTTFKYSGSGIELSDEEIRIMCAVICDGTFVKEAEFKYELKTHKQCRFHIKKERKKERLRLLFSQANIEWREKESSTEGYTDFYIQSPRREKEFSSYWYNCSNEQLQVICDEIINWDGSVSNGRTSFSSTVKETADFVQFAFSSCGKRVNMKERDRIGQKKISSNGKEYERKSIEYELTISDVTDIGITYFGENKTKIEEFKTRDGYKYCFRVPSGMLVLRNNNKIFCTGNSGKTTGVNGLIALCEDNGLTYTLLAPTGKASLRMKESTKRRASTIHRKVLCDKEITTDVVIIDEASMIDLATFVMLLQAVTDDNTRVVLVGDNAQLLPVGLGCVFNNIIESEVVPMTMLTDIFRYDSSGALFVATNTRNGKPFFDSDELDSNGKPIVTYKNNTYKVGDNYSFIETEDIFSELTKIYMGLIDKGVKPDEILCLSPYNVGDVGTYAINSAIQAEINPPKANENIKDRKINQTSIVFRTGDRLLNKQNDYKAIPLEVWEQIQNDETNVLSPDDFELLSIFNGQDGKIVDIDDKKLVAQFDEDLIVFDRMKINNLLLGYCISVHASQGSEAKYVINVVSKEHKNLNKNMLYVADTRAKYKHWDIGSTSAYNEALLIDGNELRDTWLLDLLKMENVA